MTFQERKLLQKAGSSNGWKESSYSPTTRLEVWDTWEKNCLLDKAVKDTMPSRDRHTSGKARGWKECSRKKKNGGYKGDWEIKAPGRKLGGRFLGGGDSSVEVTGLRKSARHIVNILYTSAIVVLTWWAWVVDIVGYRVGLEFWQSQPAHE